MKVHTNAGDVEMTAAMVRPGMVFQDPTGAPYKLVRFDPYAVAWSDSDGALTEAEVAVAHTFLGCDPVIAAREDVERYGVAPDIDAGVHGFARLQDGGAVDLQDPESFRRGMVFEIVAVRYGSLHGQRFVLAERVMGDGNGGELWECWGDGGGDWRMWKAVRDGHVRLVGLDMHHARREDVLRLCCLDANRLASGPGGERCTLAIGDHDTHEDLATGVRWPARAALPAVDELPVITGEALDGPAAAWGVERRPAEPDDELRARAGRQVRGMMQAAAKVVPPDASRWTPIAGVTWHYEAQPVSSPDKARASIPPASTLTIDDVEQPVRCPRCSALSSPGQGVWCSAKCRNEHARESADVQRALAAIGEDAKRRATEAPLVALVAAVPEGLDPIGWRAAVLCLAEEKVERDWREYGKTLESWLRVYSPHHKDPPAVKAYHRALAPQGPRPVPERKIGGRAVRLVVDNGSDD